jgi:hypothetical protein
VIATRLGARPAVECWSVLRREVTVHRQSLPLLFVAFALATPALADHRDPSAVSVPVHYSDQAVVISTKDGVAIVRFTDAAPDGRKYVYRFLPSAEPAKQERGEGKVFEKYDRKPARPPKEGFEVTDAGGQLKVVAGKIALEWSIGSENSGWLYFMPEDERVQLVHAEEFEKLKLSRFAK